MSAKLYDDLRVEYPDMNDDQKEKLAAVIEMFWEIEEP